MRKQKQVRVESKRINKNRLEIKEIILSVVLKSGCCREDSKTQRCAKKQKITLCGPLSLGDFEAISKLEQYHSFVTMGFDQSHQIDWLHMIHALELLQVCPFFSRPAGELFAEGVSVKGMACPFLSLSHRRSQAGDLSSNPIQGLCKIILQVSDILNTGGDSNHSRSHSMVAEFRIRHVYMG